MNKISTEDMPGNSTPVIVSHVHVRSKAGGTGYRLVYGGAETTIKEAWTTALWCASGSAKVDAVRTAASVIANVLMDKHNVDDLLKFATDPVWEETGITVDIYYDEAERSSRDAQAHR